MKLSFTIAFTLCVGFCFAQRQNVYFLKNNGELASVRDSADFIRIVREPEKSSKLYPVLEYFKDGNQKLIGQSSTVEPVQLEGTCITFFNNGQRHVIANYQIGHLVKDYYEYYPNGRLYLNESYPNEFKYQEYTGKHFITEAYDSLGNAKIKDGRGYYIGYNDDFTKVTEEGAVDNGVRAGEWKGVDERDTATFTEKYLNGVLTEGTAIKNGKTLLYTKARTVKPQFPNGEIAFGAFLGRSIRYPADAREKGIQGTVVLKFVIERDGRLTSIKVINPVSKSLDEEAVRAISGSPNWVPGTKYGVPVRVEYSVPIKFVLGVAR